MTQVTLSSSQVYGIFHKIRKFRPTLACFYFTTLDLKIIFHSPTLIITLEYVANNCSQFEVNEPFQITIDAEDMLCLTRFDENEYMFCKKDDELCITSIFDKDRSCEKLFQSLSMHDFSPPK